MTQRFTPEQISELKPNEVFVYGSNQYAIHGAGSARKAIDFGATYKDVPMGLCGQSYGIITKSFSNEPVTIGFIGSQVRVLYEFAKLRPDLTFYVTKIGTALAGFSVEEIGDIFRKLTALIGLPSNIILPKEFH